HHYFSTREELLEEALIHSFERAGEERFSESSEGAQTAAQALARGIGECLPLPGPQEREWVLWVELWLRAVREPALRPVAAGLYDRYLEWMAGLIRAGVESGEFRSDADPETLADVAMALLDAAAGVIAERGIAATRIADVAERAGTSPPAVLYWFESKDELLAEALTVEEERFYEALTDRMESLERPRDKLRLMLESSAEE